MSTQSNTPKNLNQNIPLAQSALSFKHMLASAIASVYLPTAQNEAERFEKNTGSLESNSMAWVKEAIASTCLPAAKKVLPRFW